jgi:lysophospholipase L1-like esterase
MKQAAKILLAGAVAAAAVLVVEVIAALRQPLIPFSNPSREPISFGSSGPKIRYVVIGDSTAAGQGATAPEYGIAVTTAKHLADKYQVTLVNLGVSGATMQSVLKDQAPKAALLKPDLVLISAGANDATHFSSGVQVGECFTNIVNTLRAANPNVRIAATGCPDMGSIPRFAQPLRWIAGTQTGRINSAIVPVTLSKQVTFLDIASTGPDFRRDPTLFAADNFHPNDRGYAVWTQVINRHLDTMQLRPRRMRKLD